MFRWRLRRRFGGTGRLILRNTNSGESDYTKQSKNVCGHDRERKKAWLLQSIQFWLRAAVGAEHDLRNGA
jgi:hypothetical protein